MYRTWLATLQGELKQPSSSARRGYNNMGLQTTAVISIPNQEIYNSYLSDYTKPYSKSGVKCYVHIHYFYNLQTVGC